MTARDTSVRCLLVALVPLVACDTVAPTSASGPRLLWSQHFVSLGSELATDGYRVFVMGTQRSVGAFRTTTGDLLWSASTATGDTSSGQTTTSTGRLGCALGPSLLICNDRELVAFLNVDGSFRWRTALSTPVQCLATCQPINISDSSVYVFGVDGSLAAVNQRTGVARWTTGSNNLAATIDTGLVVLGSSVGQSPNAMTALSVATGAKRWSASLPASAQLVTGMAMWHAVVLATANDGNVYGFDRTTGSLLWSVAGADTVTLTRELVPCISGTQPQPMLVLGNTLFVLTSTGAMAMFDLPTHTLLHRVTTALGPHLGVPLVADSNAVYVIGLNGDVGAFSIADAHLMQAYSITPEKICAMTQWQDRIFVLGETGVSAISKALTP